MKKKKLLSALLLALALNGSCVFASGETITEVNNASKAYLNGEHNVYTLSTEQGQNTDNVIINNTKYYYTPNESSIDLNNALTNLANTGSGALITTTEDNALFTIYDEETDTTSFYTYDSTKLPTSTYSLAQGSGNFNVTKYSVDESGNATPTNYTLSLANTSQGDIATYLRWETDADNNKYLTTTDTEDNADITYNYNSYSNINTLTTLKEDFTNLMDGRTADSYTLSTRQRDGDTAIIFRIPDDLNNPKTYYFTPSDDEREILTKIVTTGNTFLKEVSAGENALFNIDGTEYTIDFNKVNQVPDTLENLTKTSTPDEYSIEAGSDSYNINSREYTNGDQLQKAFQWDMSSGTRELIEVDIDDAYDISIGYNITPRQGGRQKADLGGEDINKNFLELSTTKEHGGAINNQVNYSIGDINAFFVNNHTTKASNPGAEGGAIYNAGTIANITGDYIQNYVNTTVSGFGGAISNSNKTGTIESINSNFIANNVITNTDAHGGAIHNSGFINTINGDFVGNYTISNKNHSYGGAISNRQSGKIVNLNGNFIGNYTYSMATANNLNANGGAISNYQKGTTIGHLTGSFIGNYAYSKNNIANGGAIYNATDSATIGEIIADFAGNYANGAEGAYGGALYNNVGTATLARVASITGDFYGNYVDGNSGEGFGGAIYNESKASKPIAHIGEINSNFVGNYALGDIAAGGAIYSQKGIIDSINGSFDSNCVEGYSEANGGVIFNGETSSQNLINATFTNNYAYAEGGNAFGGAIHNLGIVGEIAGDFINNSAETSNGAARGGAIYTNGATTKINGNFINNYAYATIEATGGAINNYHSDTAIEEINGIFINNSAEAYNGTSHTTAYGGAIRNNGEGSSSVINNIIGNFTGNYVDAKLSGGGAIDNYNNAHIENITADFVGNYAIGDRGYGGAIYNFNNATIGSITGDFLNNYASGTRYGQGGAIHNSQNSLIGTINGSFIGNYTNSQSPFIENIGGGAIYNISSKIGDIFGDFQGNYVTSTANLANGGAISNVSALIGAVSGDFISNYSINTTTNANNGGGAIYSEDSGITLIDSSFYANATNNYGGAILNVSNGPSTYDDVNIAAVDDDVEFTGNKQLAEITQNSDGTFTVTGGESNAIYNSYGNINLIAAEEKSITFNDNIDGNHGIININDYISYFTLDDNLDEIIKDLDQIGGNYVFNADVANNTINLFNNGNIVIGESGTLHLNGFTNDDNNGTLDALNGTMQDLSLGATELYSDLNFKMDLDVRDPDNIKSDTITVDGDNNIGNFVISNINLVGNIKIENFDEDTEFTKRVLFGEDDTTILTLGQGVLNTTKHKEITGSDDWTGPNINWNEEHGSYTIDRTIESHMDIIGSDDDLLDTLDWIILVTDGEKTYHPQADNLQLVNQYETELDRNFNFDSANDEFIVTQDSGTTAAGKLVINGKIDDNGNKSTINGTDADGNSHDLFDMENIPGKTTTVVINDTLITGANTVADVAQGNTLILNDSDIVGNTNGIINNGNLQLNGNNLIDDDISHEADSTKGTFDVLSGTTTIGDSATVEQGTVNTANNNSSLDIDGVVTVTDKLGNKGAINVSDTGVLNLNGNNLENEGSIVNNNELNVNANSGLTTNSGNIENNGNFTVNSEFKNTGNIEGANGVLTNNSNNFVNNNKISQDTFNNDGVTVNNGTISVNDLVNNDTLTTNASNITATNGVKNEGVMNLNGGTNNNNITTDNGQGTINITGDVANTANIQQKEISNNGILRNTGAVGVETLTNTQSIINDSSITVNSQFANNGKVSGNGNLENNGALNNSNGLISQNNIVNSGEITTNSERLIANNAIDNTGVINYTSGATTVSDITGNSNGNVNISTGDNFVINNKISGTQLTLNDATLFFGNNANISQAASFNVNGGAINSLNNKIDNINLGNVNLNERANLSIDFDLNNITSDTFVAQVNNNGGIFNVTNINVSGTTVKDYIRVHLGDTTKLGKDNVTSDYIELPSIMTPIRKLSGNVSDGYLTYQGTGNGAKDFNPAVMASPAATLVGGFLTQSQVLQDGFFHMDRYTKYSHSQRMAAENTNKYAIEAGTPVYRRSYLPETSSAMWVKPYTTFEKVNLKGGIGVSNITYGALYGGDTNLVDLGKGYKGVVSAFVGYNGSHQSYNGIDMNQQGGSLGVTGTLYKGNFFTGLTVSTGASAGEAYTPYGTDHFAMLTAGVANKTGYNFELANGKLIIQPSVFLGYTFVNTFDYTNSAGVRIKSDPLNAIQVAPGVKLIGNLKNGWQPYAGVDMMWNIMGRTDFVANETRLPSLSVKPYIQYGAGIQKTWGDRFTGFFQTMIRNGGRNGIVLQAGFRWAIGKDYHSIPDEYKTDKKVIKVNENSLTSKMDGSKNVVIGTKNNKKVISQLK